LAGIDAMTPYTILQTMRASGVWQPWFRDPSTWSAWRVFLSVLFGLPVDLDGLDLYQHCTGRLRVPMHGFSEAWLVCGRRAGKSFILALIACFLAVFRDWRLYLAPGEIGTIKIIATDRRQGRVIHRYCRALLTRPEAVSAYVERDTGEEIVLNNGITIEIQTASFRSVRGYTIIACLCDELAFWRSDEESANPDQEIIDALRPAMSTIPGAMLLCASSPYARRGALWNAYHQHHGDEDSPVLVWHADTRTMNPTIDHRIIEEAYERDPAWAAAEYGAEFRTDIETFVSRDAVDACVVEDIREHPPRDHTRYNAFIDPAGGSGGDSMTLAISHREGDKAILDCLREVRPEFVPENVAAEFTRTLKTYRITEVTGDAYAGDWPKDAFRKLGITYRFADKRKSDIYLDFLPLLNGRRVSLLDHPKALAQLCSLERRTGRGGGKDLVDHPRTKGAHDDLANALGGALTHCLARRSLYIHPDVLRRSERIFTRPMLGSMNF
jgi:hypothetical protein